MCGSPGKRQLSGTCPGWCVQVRIWGTPPGGALTVGGRKGCPRPGPGLPPPEERRVRSRRSPRSSFPSRPSAGPAGAHRIRVNETPRRRLDPEGKAGAAPQQPSETLAQRRPRRAPSPGLRGALATLPRDTVPTHSISRAHCDIYKCYTQGTDTPPQTQQIGREHPRRRWRTAVRGGVSTVSSADSLHSLRLRS